MDAAAYRFGHSKQTRLFWRRLVKQALETQETPFYIFSTEPLEQALKELETLSKGLKVPVRHWLSCKTQPVPALMKWWQAQGRGIEVVSEFELQAALRAGFEPEQILVNGPAKQRWLSKYALEGLRVNFDSEDELESLMHTARRLDWSVGVRCQTSEEVDPEHAEWPTQFGLQADRAVRALKRMARAGLRLETIHFHLRTNVASAHVYERALAQVAEICRAARFNPRFVDCGGGLPPHGVLAPDGEAYDGRFRLEELAGVYRRAIGEFGSVEELWLENGRFISARAGVLVVRIVDVKERTAIRQLICDGGRTMNALIASWEEHELFSLPDRRGRQCWTAVCGPTCMAFDRLARRPMPKALATGDYLVWMDAGAYHIPWETHFSHGLAGVLWHQEGRLRLIRKTESFDAWWGRWE